MQFPDDIPMLEGWNIAAKCEIMKVESQNRCALPLCSFNLWWQVLPVLSGCAIWAWVNVGFEGMLKHKNDSIDRTLDSQIPKSKSPNNPQAIMDGQDVKVLRLR